MDTAMEFELAMRMLFGDKAYHIAAQHGNSSARREWLTKALRHLERDVDTLDTTVRHKERLMAEMDILLVLLKQQKDPSWDLVYSSLRLVMRLLGYDYVPGARCHTATYWQSTGQHWHSVVAEGGHVMQDYYDKRNAISVRRSVVLDLKAQGLDDYKIALVLNTTEYQIKQLRRNTPALENESDAL